MLPYFPVTSEPSSLLSHFALYLQAKQEVSQSVIPEHSEKHQRAHADIKFCIATASKPTDDAEVATSGVQAAARPESILQFQLESFCTVSKKAAVPPVEPHTSICSLTENPISGMSPFRTDLKKSAVKNHDRSLIMPPTALAYGPPLILPDQSAFRRGFNPLEQPNHLCQCSSCIHSMLCQSIGTGRQAGGQPYLSRDGGGESPWVKHTTVRNELYRRMVPYNSSSKTSNVAPIKRRILTGLKKVRPDIPRVLVTMNNDGDEEDDEGNSEVTATNNCCPECSTSFSVCGPLRDKCGHVKCKKCFAETFLRHGDQCSQCQAPAATAVEAGPSPKRLLVIDVGGDGNQVSAATPLPQVVLVGKKRNKVGAATRTGTRGVEEDDEAGRRVVEVGPCKNTSSSTNPNVAAQNNGQNHGEPARGQLPMTPETLDALSSFKIIKHRRVSPTKELSLSSSGWRKSKLKFKLGRNLSKLFIRKLKKTSSANQLINRKQAQLQINVVSKGSKNKSGESGGSFIQLTSKASSTKISSDRIAEEKRSSRRKRNPCTMADHIVVIQDPDSSGRWFQCTVCSKKFKTKAHAKYHEFCDNSAEKPFKCEQCGQGFISKSHYEYHQRVHTGERPYKCPNCGKGFNQQGKVTRHMRSHTGEKPFQCTLCGRSFANNQALRSHELVHTGERPYPCNHCPKRFTGLTNLKKHLITHTGERPHTCTVCNKSFGLKWTLDLHMKTHSSEKPYKCQQCTRAFSNSKDLRRHSLIHTSLRPFVCQICGTSFRRKDNLDRHVRQTHKISRDDPRLSSMQSVNIADYHAAAQHVGQGDMYSYDKAHQAGSAKRGKRNLHRYPHDSHVISSSICQEASTMSETITHSTFTTNTQHRLFTSLESMDHISTQQGTTSFENAAIMPVGSLHGNDVVSNFTAASDMMSVAKMEKVDEAERFVKELLGSTDYSCIQQPVMKVETTIISDIPDFSALEESDGMDDPPEVYPIPFEQPKGPDQQDTDLHGMLCSRSANAFSWGLKQFLPQDTHSLLDDTQIKIENFPDDLL